MNQTHLDVPQCPNGHGDMAKVKEWRVEGKPPRWKKNMKPKGFTTELWKCPVCGQGLRRTKK